MSNFLEEEEDYRRICMGILHDIKQIEERGSGGEEE